MKKTLAILLSMALVIALIPATASVAFAVPTVDLANAQISLSPTSATYDGTNQKPTVTVTVGETELKEGTDYSVAWTKDNNSVTVIDNVATYKVIVAAALNHANYKGSKEANFTVNQLDLANTKVILSPQSVLYNGTPRTTAVTVKADGKIIPANDYSIEGNSKTDAGEYTVTVSANGSNTKNSNTATFTVEKIDFTKATVDATGTVDSSSIESVGSGTVNNDGTTNQTLFTSLKGLVAVKQGTETVNRALYKISKCEINAAKTNVRVYVKVDETAVPGAIVNNVENISNEIFVDIPVTTVISSSTYTIKYYNNVTESDTIPDQEYTGEPITPGIRVYKNGTPSTLLSPSCYKVNYTNNVNGGRPATVTVTGIGSYSGSISTTFNIKKKDINSSDISVSNVGTAVKNGYPSSITVKFGNKELVQGTDYEFESGTLNSSVVGSQKGTINIVGLGNFDKRRSVKFDVAEKNINSAVVSPSFINSTVSYNGYVQEPSFYVTLDSSPIYKNNQYTVSYRKAGETVGTSQPKDAGRYSVYLVGKYPACGGELYIGTFTINAINTSNVTATASQASTSSPLVVTVKSKVDNVTFTQGKDYTVTLGYIYNGKGTATITPIDGSNLTGPAITVQYTINGKNITYCSAEFASGSKQSNQYTGSAIKPQVKVRDGYTTLTEGTDYTVTYKDAAGKVIYSPIETGTYTIVIEGKGAYSGTKTMTFYIVGTDISGYTVTLKESSVNATGYSQTPVITSVKKGYYYSLTSNDYTVSYQDSTGKTVYSMSAPGTYRVVVTGKNGYSGSTYATFRIVGTPQTLTVAQDSYKKYPTSDSFKITATATGDGTGFTYTSSNPAVASVSAAGYVTIHKVGKAVITVATTGNKKSEPTSKDVVVKVYPKKTVLAKKPWTDGKKAQLKVRWNYQDGATKYQIRYSRDKNFKAGTYLTKTVNAHGKDYTTQSTTVTKLKRGYTYYIKVRAVYTDPITGDNYYGSWSGWRSAKTI